MGKLSIVDVLNEVVEAGLLPRSGRVITLGTKAGPAAVVDEEEQWATRLTWHVHRSGKNVYLCHAYAPTVHVNLHSHFLPARPRSEHIDVDHIDGDSLNNRRSNLRYVSHSTNVAKGMRSSHEKLLTKLGWRRDPTGPARGR